MARDRIDHARPDHPDVLRAAVGQPHLLVGDLERNRDSILRAMAWAEEQHADVLVLPELALTGYPPEDLLHTSGFVDDNLAMLEELAAASGDVVTVVGFVDQVGGAGGTSGDSTPRNLANAVALLAHGRVRGRYHKVLLPNYGVFDEGRYFAAGTVVGGTWHIRSFDLGVIICEDMWRPDFPDAQAAAGARAMLSANASPYHVGKPEVREAIVRDVARRGGMPVIYSNCVGGQDEVVFDGGSLVVDAYGQVVARAPLFAETLFAVDVPLPDHPRTAARPNFVSRPAPRRGQRPAVHPPLVPLPDDTEEVYRALVTSLRDHVVDNGFSQVLLGLSGGVDSALVATIAVDALGDERVWCVAMPGPWSPAAAVTDAEGLAGRLGTRFDVVPVTGALDAHLAAAPGTRDDTAGEWTPVKEGLLRRVRASVLTRLCDEHGGIVLPTANKTETALGYVTLYGDLAGSFAVLKDVPKRLVYQLCRWRTGIDGAAFGWTPGTGLIPERIINKTPSARMMAAEINRPLPSDEVLDAIIERWVEWGESPDQIVASGFDPAVVERIIRLVDRSEPNRRQTAPGVKISSKAFGRDRRLPLTHGYQPRVRAPERAVVPEHELQPEEARTDAAPPALL